MHGQIKHSLVYLQDLLPTLADIKTHQPNKGLWLCWLVDDSHFQLATFPSFLLQSLFFNFKIYITPCLFTFDRIRGRYIAPCTDLLSHDTYTHLFPC